MTYKIPNNIKCKQEFKRKKCLNQKKRLNNLFLKQIFINKELMNQSLLYKINQSYKMQNKNALLLSLFFFVYIFFKIIIKRI